MCSRKMQRLKRVLLLSCYGESRRCKSKLSFNGCEKSAQKKWHYSRILMRRRRTNYATMAFELAIVAYVFNSVCDYTELFLEVPNIYENLYMRGEMSSMLHTQRVTFTFIGKWHFYQAINISYLLVIPITNCTLERCC